MKSDVTVLQMEKWAGKVALVTGASSGIGRALTIELVKNGLRVVALARRLDRLESLESSLKNSQGQIKGIKCDVRNENEIKAAFKWVDENWGNVSVLVNNAGVGDYVPLEELEAAAFRRMLETNLVGMTTCTREMITYFKKHKAGEGHIININSTLGHKIYDLPGFAPYTSTKHAVTSLSTSLKYELAKQRLPIRVSSISPGMTDTEFIDDIRDKTKPDKPCLQDSDVVQCVVFALSAPKKVNVIEIMVEGLEC